ncbi:MAG: peptide deformylase [Candidatus Liptonbacteria bacterium]|nr:peptide deformylase [Candidatus Liptonbacteria bacterium]
MIWNFEIEQMYLITNKQEYKFLRRAPRPFDFSSRTAKETRELLARMKKAMHEAKGIGLSANQIGIDAQVFIAEVPSTDGGQKFYAVFNPSIEKMGEAAETSEEGCLSIPGKFGEVPRAASLILRGFDTRGKPLKIKAWGLLARVFQHETDHLNGKLFVDRATKIYEVSKSNREYRESKGK